MCSATKKFCANKSFLASQYANMQFFLGVHTYEMKLHNYINTSPVRVCI